MCLFWVQILLLFAEYSLTHCIQTFTVFAASFFSYGSLFIGAPGKRMVPCLNLIELIEDSFSSCEAASPRLFMTLEQLPMTV